MLDNTQITRPLLASLGLRSLHNPEAWSHQPKDAVCLAMLTLYVTAKQIETLTKCQKFGWKFTKIVWNSTEQKCAIALGSDGCAGWVLPNGVLERADRGKKTAYLPNGWKEME